MPTLICDIETDGLLPTMTRVWQLSVMDADTEVLTSYNDAGQGDGRSLAEGLACVSRADITVWHHGLGFDWWAIKLAYPDLRIDPTKIVDTLVLSRLGRPDRPYGHGLEAWGHRVGLEKVTHDDWTKWSPAMEQRCNDDVRITALVYKRLLPMFKVMPRAVLLEHKVAWETAKLIHRGFGLDVDYCHQLVSEYLSELEIIEAELQEIFPPWQVHKDTFTPKRNNSKMGYIAGKTIERFKTEVFNPGSRQQVARRLVDKYQWRPKKKTPTGIPEVSEDVLKDLPYPEAPMLCDYFSLTKKVGRIQGLPDSRGHGGGWLHYAVEHDFAATLLADQPPHHRVHASLNPNRCVSHRPSCASPSIQQVDKKDIRMRKAWVPRPGYVLVGVDSAGIEMRCLAHYLFPLDGGAFAKTVIEGNKADGTDQHTLVQKMIGFHDRDNTKRAEYGLIYGAGDAKLGMIAFKDAYEAKEQIRYDVLGLSVAGGGSLPSNTVVGRAIRAAIEQGITGLDDLTAQIKSIAQETGKLQAIDGRTLWVRSPHSALNLLLQSAGIISVKEAMAIVNPMLQSAGLVEDKDYALVMWIHDELQFEALEECAPLVGDTVIAAMVQAGVNLEFNLPLDGASKIGATWAETH